MVVEDLHWIDPTSKQLLAVLIDQVPTIPLFMLLTARPGFEPSWPTQSYVMPLMLDRLSRGETEQMIDQLAGGKPLPAEVAAEIVSRTDGVPLFVEELTKMLLESDLIQAREGRYALTGPLPPLAIPTTLQDSLAARLDRLAAVKPLAQLCATLGREFSYALLHRVSAFDEVLLQGSLDQLVRGEFLHQLGTGSEAVYTFKHVLIQEAAYHSLLKSRRQQFHGRIAKVLVEQFQSEAEAQPELVALHLTRAGDCEAALSWWQKAGQYAFRRASYAEAIAHYSSGLRVLESLPDERRRAQLELALQVELGYSLIPLRGWGALDTAHAFSRADELSRQIGDTPSQFRALWGVGAFHFVRGDQRKARDIAEQCLALAQQSKNEDALIEAHYLLGHHALRRGRLRLRMRPNSRQRSNSTVAMFGSPTACYTGKMPRPRRSVGWPWRDGFSGIPRTPLRKPTRASRSCETRRNRFSWHAEWLAWDSFMSFAESRADPTASFPPCLHCAPSRDSHTSMQSSPRFREPTLVLLGDHESGIQLMQESVGALRAMGSELLLTLILVNLANAHLGLGHIDEARAVLDEGFSAVERNGEHWAESELHRLRGQSLQLQGSPPTQAEACLRKAIAIAREQHARAFEIRACVALARNLERQLRIDEAKALLSAALVEWPAGFESMDLRDARELLVSLG